ncbi:MAG: M1 family aminopeptidase [Planctomycetota bacterium]
MRDLARSVLLLTVAALAASAHARGFESWFREGSSHECLACRAAMSGMLPSELRYDLHTGEDLRNFPPPREADFLSMLLVLRVPDMNDPTFDGAAKFIFTPIGDDLHTLTLDANQLEIDSILSQSDTVAGFSHDGEKLTIRFDPPVKVGFTCDVTIGYAVDDPPDGLFWTPQSEAWGDRPAQLHTQGQPQTNSYWFPCHDFPNDRMETEIIISVPEGFVASSNGSLASEPITRNGTSTFHWVQKPNHPAYLVSLIVGKFEIIDVAPEGSDIPMPVYVPEGMGERVQRTYGNTARMIETYERVFDEPYPWSRYAQLVVHNFGYGGMENTAATTMFGDAILDEKAMLDGNLEGLISHEVAHQWFGDLLTCNSWEHLWLNEGFATYLEGIWYEERDGYENGYLPYVYRESRGVAERDQLEPGSTTFRPGMVSNVYHHPDNTFRRISNPYPKGCSILHMLRAKVGDELFFKSLATYIDRHKFSTVETVDLRRAFEDTTGKSLEHFFEQWCERPGTPRPEITLSWNAESSELRIEVEQTQRINAQHPAFSFDLPIEIYSGPGAKPIDLTLPITRRLHERTITLDAEPAMVAVDPSVAVMMHPDLDAPRGWLLAQLEHGPTVPSRIDAARFLRKHDSAIARNALAQVIANTSEHHEVRREAAESLGTMSASHELAETYRAGVDDARVRRAIVNGLRDCADDEALSLLVQIAGDASESYRTQGDALVALGDLGDASHFDTLASGLDVPSQYDDVRRGAIRGLAELDHPKALDAVIPYTRLGYYSRTRPDAITAVAMLAHHNRKKALDAVAPLLRDRELRTVRAAIEAVADIEHEAGLEVLDRFIDTTRNPKYRTRAQDARAKLAGALSGERSSETLAEEVERLRREVERMNERETGAR